MVRMLLFFGKKLQTLRLLGIGIVPVFCTFKEVSIEGQGLTAVEKIFNKMQLGPHKFYAGSDVRVK
jgi:aconitate hydratase 2/2-methylisocitrate dehydratase